MPASISNQENEVPTESQPPKKKVKKELSSDGVKKEDASKPSKYAKTKAKLSLLPSLPLDILFEIFGHLPPLDLLHLARTTQGFRSVLMHKSAISIWKASLQQVPGLPERPQEMSEPAWANLVWSPHCHNCLTNRCQKVDWHLRIRLCEKCVKTAKLLRGERQMDKTNKLDQIILQCLPFSHYHIPGHNGKCCLIEDERKFRKELKAAEDKSEFVKSKKEALAARVTHASECKKWLDSSTQERWDELAEIRYKRTMDISEKLEDLGFIEELEYLEDLKEVYLHPRKTIRPLRDHPDVKVSKPLTERSWKNIEPRLVEYMGQVRTHLHAADRLRIVRQREKVAVAAWVQFRLQYPAEKLVPSGTDILSWEKVKNIIDLPSDVPTKSKDGDVSTAKANEDGTPTLISPASFTRIFESMKLHILKWGNDRLRDLAEESPVSPLFAGWTGAVYSSQSERMKSLELAACVFSCEDKSDVHCRFEHYQDGAYPVMWFPEFIHHPCNTIEVGKLNDDDDESPNPLFQALKTLKWYRRREWSSDSIFFNEKASKVVKRILFACGLDHQVTTTREMDELDPRFICLKCSYGAKCDGQRPRKVMSWRHAVQHCMLVHWGDASVTWERITEESAAEARVLSAARSIASDQWRCAHCRDSVHERDGKGTEALMRDHLDILHNIFPGVKGRDYHLAVDSPPPAMATVQITPKEVVVA
ncbi:hypothetical protein C8F04DRAFT_162777 [Mycena alexandri]|uniref:F-box domain-containing protein n=1 Tax=Mycena alexandri TaxID=1745969 RepID=A0AAD6SAT3_9AGAR|nr:hypothetical protein C8F04DRAFT_162777 [Mycena alexandri]